MTLVTTEIWLGSPVSIVMAADRRISRAGKPDSNRRKLFELPGGRLGAISYFGLAEVILNTRVLRMDQWLGDFLHKYAAMALGDLAHALAATLNGIPRLDRSQRSGFQLAGFAPDGAPQFWFIRNLDDCGEPTLGEWQAREDFLGRDAIHVAPGQGWAYRNGDFRAHAAAWEVLDESFGQLLVWPDFGLPPGPEGRMRWVRFKMDVIATFYDQFATTSILGKPIDALVITPTGVVKWSRWSKIPALPWLPFRRGT